jgi:hypothetical protein
MKYKYLQLKKKSKSDYPTCTVHMREKDGNETNVQLAGDRILVVPIGASFANLRDVQQKIQAGSLIPLSGEEVVNYLYEKKEWEKEQIREFVHTADVKFVNKLSDSREAKEKMTESATPEPVEADPVESLDEERAPVETVRGAKRPTKAKK